MSAHKTPDFLVVIPARLGSTRLPRKPLADIGGKPMVVRVAERAKQSLANSVVVATDSAEIEAACHEHHIECLLTSSNHPTGTDRLAEVAQLLKLPANALLVKVMNPWFHQSSLIKLPKLWPIIPSVRSLLLRCLSLKNQRLIIPMLLR